MSTPKARARPSVCPLLPGCPALHHLSNRGSWGVLGPARNLCTKKGRKTQAHQGRPQGPGHRRALQGKPRVTGTADGPPEHSRTSSPRPHSAKPPAGLGPCPRQSPDRVPARTPRLRERGPRPARAPERCPASQACATADSTLASGGLVSEAKVPGAVFPGRSWARGPVAPVSAPVGEDTWYT